MKLFTSLIVGFSLSYTTQMLAGTSPTVDPKKMSDLASKEYYFPNRSNLVKQKIERHAAQPVRYKVKAENDPCKALSMSEGAVGQPCMTTDKFIASLNLSDDQMRRFEYYATHSDRVGRGSLAH